MPSSRLLIVDDDPDILDVLVEFLSAPGLEIRTVRDGSLVLAAVRDFRPNVVMLDLGLPGVDGRLLLAQLRAFDPSVPVIILTGSDTPGIWGDLVGEGAVDVLTKPFELDVVRRTVGAALALRRPPPQDA